MFTCAKKANSQKRQIQSHFSGLMRRWGSGTNVWKSSAITKAQRGRFQELILVEPHMMFCQEQPRVIWLPEENKNKNMAQYRLQD